MIRVIVLTAAALLATPAFAQTRSQVYGNELTQQSQTVYMQAEGGITTYESQVAESKETKSSIATTLGGWFGEDRTAGASVSNSESHIGFSLNGSKMHTAFTDVRAIVRLGWIMPSVGVSLSEVEVDQKDQKTMSVYATGANAGLAVGIPLNKSMVVYGDGMAVKAMRGFDRLGGEAKMGDRKELNAGVSFDVTERMLDLLVGYRAREYNLQGEDKSYQEKTQGAYAGLRLGLYF
jgi:hypothetical protein